MKRKMLMGAAVLAAALASPAAAQNLVANGNFESGFTGFDTDYAPVTMTGPNAMVPEGTVAVGSNAANYHYLWANVPAHGGSNYLIANGAPGSNVDVWRQTVATVAGQTYRFSAFITNVCCNAGFNGTNGTPVIVAANGGMMSLSGTATGTGAWVNLFGSFTATGASTTINIYNDNSVASGNDFGLDDISLTAVPEPASWGLMILGFGAIGYAMRRQQRRSDAKFDARIRMIAAGEVA